LDGTKAEVTRDPVSYIPAERTVKKVHCVITQPPLWKNEATEGMIA
jgi:hypothetical protein